MSDRLKKLVEENLRFRELVKYTQQDLDDLFFEYDRMSTSGQETLEKLAELVGVPTEEEISNMSEEELVENL